MAKEPKKVWKGRGRKWRGEQAACDVHHVFLDQLFLVCPCRVEEHINKRWLGRVRKTPLSSFVVVVVVVVVVIVVVVVVFVIEEYINKRWRCRVRETPLFSTKPWTGAS